MPVAAAVGVASLAIGMVTGFAVTMRALGRIELKLDLIWDWYLREHSPQVIPGGRRRSDPPRLDD